MMRADRLPVWVSHDPKLEPLYRELRALRAVDQKTCIAPEWVSGRLAKIRKRIDHLVAMHKREHELIPSELEER